MNDIDNKGEIKQASPERQRTRLINDFMRGVKQERERMKAHSITQAEAYRGIYTLFTLLLERSGYPIITDSYMNDFWGKVSARLESYLEKNPENQLAYLTKIQNDIKLDEWAAEKIQAYGSLIKGPAPLAKNRGGFGARMMSFFQ